MACGAEEATGGKGVTLVKRTSEEEVTFNMHMKQLGTLFKCIL